MSQKEILICGAGPSGLSSAIFLHDLGYHPRIIDKKKEISPYSKALGINPRTLGILEPSGITKRFLENGKKMPAMNIWKKDKFLLRNEFAKVKHKYPFVLVQTQKESEEILLDEVQKRGMNVEYGTELLSFEKQNGKYISKLSSELRTPSSDLRSPSSDLLTPHSELISDFIIASDGGHSVIRKQLNVPFPGMRYGESWELHDVELDLDWKGIETHIRIFPEGGMIMIPIRENIWRVAGNLKGLLNFLPAHTKAGKIHWQTEFFVSHHVASKLVHDNIVLIGDAAHLHSPIGGRGMNLGIEDAYITSKLIHENRLPDYDSIRLKYLQKTVKRINFISEVMTAKSGTRKFFKRNVNLFRPFFPIAKPFMRKFALALDHEPFI